MRSSREKSQEQTMLQARERQMQLLTARQQQLQLRAMDAIQTRHPMGDQMGQAQTRSTNTFGLSMATSHDDIPITEANDLDLFTGQPLVQQDIAPFSSRMSEWSSPSRRVIVKSKSRTPAFLHQGLVAALGAGSVNAARYLFAAGTPITRQTPGHVLSAPAEQQIRLFELLAELGWSTNTPGFYGAVLFPSIVANETLLDWFLAHGADPNLGTQRDNRDRYGEPDTDSCMTLEAAASHGSVEAVQKLLGAGAQIQNGAPLYFAAGACPPGANPHVGLVTPSKEMDEWRIPIMTQLVKDGADVNQKFELRHMNPQYPLVHAVMAGAVERVKWLLSRGADPDMRGAFGSAAQYAQMLGSDEMKRVLHQGGIVGNA